MRQDKLNDIFWEIAKEGDAKFINFFLDNGADIDCTHDASDMPSFTPLMVALRKRYKEASILLIKRGANVSPYSRWKITPLMLAAGYGRDEEVVALLIRKKSKVNAEDIAGNTALTYAISNNNEEEKTDCQKVKKIVELLVTHGSAVNFKNEQGDTPLSLAIERGYQEVAEFLRQNGAKK